MPDLRNDLVALADQVSVPDPPLLDELIALTKRRHRRRRVTSLIVAIIGIGLAVGLVVSLLPEQRPPSSQASLAMALTAGRTELDTHAGPPVGAFGLIGSDGIWVLNGDGLFTSNNNGGSWTRTFPPSAGDPLADFMAIDYVDLQHGWVVASRENSVQVDRTVDGGATWQVTSLPTSLFPSGWNGASVTFTNALDGWLTVQPYVAPGTSPVSVLLASTDGGATWSLVNSFAPVAKMDFETSQLGWGINPEGTALFRTTDGGESWDQVDLGTTTLGGTATWRTLTLPDFFGNVGVMLAVPDKGNAVLERTANGGSTWTAKTTPFTALPVSAAFESGTLLCPGCVAPTDEPFTVLTVNSSIYWGGGKLYMTTDGGGAWTSAVPNLAFPRLRTASVTVGGQRIPASAEPLQFSSSTTGWAVATSGNRSLLLRTKNGGRSFVAISPPTSGLP